MKKIPLFLLIIISVSCKKEIESIHHTIHGNIEGIDKKMLVTLDEIDYNSNNSRIDSVHGMKNTFKFSIPKTKTPKKHQITIYNDSLKKPITSIYTWFENEDIIISGNLNKRKFEIKGGKLNDIAKEFNQIITLYDTPEINNKISSAKNPIEVKTIIKKYIDKMYSDKIELIYRKPNNYVSIAKLIESKNKISKDSLKLYYSLLNDTMKLSKRGKLLKGFISIDELKVGDFIQDFEAKDINGNTIRLTDFKNKIILLDFWASWCVPCHKQNQEEFSSLFTKYKNKGLVIISYSLDKKSAEKAWKKASKNDKISWINISNLKGFNDPLSIQYNVNVIPNSFLIGKNGQIIKSFIGYEKGSNLIEKEIIKLLN